MRINWQCDLIQYNSDSAFITLFEFGTVVSSGDETLESIHSLDNNILISKCFVSIESSPVPSIVIIKITNESLHCRRYLIVNCN